MMTKELTLQEKIGRAKPGDVIYHGVEDPSPLVLMEKPTVDKEWALDFVTQFNRTRYHHDEETAIKEANGMLKELGVEIVDD